MKKIFVMAVCLAASMFLPTMAAAQKGVGAFKVHQIERAAESLGIDESTVGKIKGLVYEGRRTGVDLRAQLEKAKIDLHERMNQASPERAGVMAAIDRMGTLRTQLKKHRVGIMLSVRSLLTPEQQSGLRKLMMKRRQNRKGKRRGPGRKGPAGGPPSW